MVAVSREVKIRNTVTVNVNLHTRAYVVYVASGANSSPNWVTMPRGMFKVGLAQLRFISFCSFFKWQHTSSMLSGTLIHVVNGTSKVGFI